MQVSTSVHVRQPRIPIRDQHTPDTEATFVRELSAVAQQLQSVRQARRRFLQLWAMEQAVILPALDRVVDDLESSIPGDLALDDSHSADVQP